MATLYIKCLSGQDLSFSLQDGKIMTKHTSDEFNAREIIIMLMNPTLPSGPVARVLDGGDRRRGAVVFLDMKGACCFLCAKGRKALVNFIMEELDP